MAASGKLVVLGGTGFIGAAICREAVLRGFASVVALSRSGRRPSADAWTDGVEWARANADEPDALRPHVEGATAVVHAVGTLFEHTGYKSLAKPERLVREGFGVLSGGSIGERTSYEKTNRDTAVALARAAAESPSVRAFVFLSAAVPRPLASLRYVSTKREAEEAIAQMGSYRTVVLRPGLVYADDDPVSAPLALAVRTAGAVAGPLFKLVPRSVAEWRDLYVPPVHVRTVARAAISGALDESASGVFCGEDIERLSDSVVRVSSQSSTEAAPPGAQVASPAAGAVPPDLRQIPVV
eukprot:Opistho-1_new@79530